MLIDNTTGGLLTAIALAALTFLGTVSIGWLRSVPLIIHNGLWAAAMLLISSELVRYSRSSIASWLLILLGILAFNFGFLALSLRRSELVKVQKLGVEHVWRPISLRSFATLLTAYAIGVAAYLINIERRFGLELLYQDPVTIRASEPGYLATVPFAFRLLLHLGPLLFTLVWFKHSTRLSISTGWRMVFLALLAFSMLILLQRTNLFTALLWVVFIIVAQIGTEKTLAVRFEASLHGLRKPRRVSTISSIIVIGLSAVLAFQVIANSLGKTGSGATTLGAVSPALQATGLTSIFTYATGGIVAFMRLADSTNTNWPPSEGVGSIVYGDFNPQTFGAATFEPLLLLFPVADPWPAIAPFIDIPFAFNVYTWYESLYRDFRSAGVAVGMFVVGGLVGYLWRRRNSSARLLWLSGLVLSIVALSTIAGRFNSTLHVVSALSTWFILRPPRAAQDDAVNSERAHLDHFTIANS